MLPNKLDFTAIGTKWRIDTDQPLSHMVAGEIFNLIESFDKTYSRFRSDSLVAKMSQHKGIYDLPESAPPLLSFYKKLYDLTDGAFTPLIGSMLEKAGYGADYSLVSHAQTELPDWDEALSWHDTAATILNPTMLDFGAAGKGYLIDLIAEILEYNHINEYLIDGSGDLRHSGTSESKIGLENPFDATEAIGFVEVVNKSICASAANRRAWGDNMHHIFDPHSKAPVQEVVATWVIADTALVADGLATALFLVMPQVLTPHFDFQYVRVRSDKSIDYSKNFEGELF